MSKPRDSVTDSACHVLKGAIVKILGTPLTISVECNNKLKGRLSVEYTKDDKPTQQEIDAIEAEANKIIKQNLPLNVITLDRKLAEETYRNNPVNNTFIYDKFPVPESVTTLTLVEIKDWNVNCCPATHLKTTGEIGSIKIAGINHRPQKKELEFRFDIGPALSDSDVAAVTGNKRGQQPQKNQQQQQQSKPAVTSDDTNIQVITKKIIELSIKNASNPQASQLEIESLLTILKNQSYATGFASAKSK
eukprot:gene803-998_t